MGFSHEWYGGGLEYFNGSEWEVVYPYQRRYNVLKSFPQKDLGYAICQEAVPIRRWGDRLPDGKYRYVKLIMDGSNPPKEYYAKIEFEIQKPE